MPEWTKICVSLHLLSSSCSTSFPRQALASRCIEESLGRRWSWRFHIRLARGMAGGGDGGDSRDLDQTPTWAVAVVCAVIVIVSLALEKVLHHVGMVTGKDASFFLILFECFWVWGWGSVRFEIHVFLERSACLRFWIEEGLESPSRSSFLHFF